MPKPASPKPNDRLTQGEVAEILGYQYDSFRTLRARPGNDLPKPDGEWGGRPWWYRSTAELWKAERERTA